jgi:hypothetical protein
MDNLQVTQAKSPALCAASHFNNRWFAGLQSGTGKSNPVISSRFGVLVLLFPASCARREPVNLLMCCKPMERLTDLAIRAAISLILTGRIPAWWCY